MWTTVLLSHAELFPSTTLISSSATLCANWPLPLPRDLFFCAAASIHITACRRRCRTPSGTGICREAPPPAAPFCDLIRRSGATESMAMVRYETGFRGRCDAGGAPGISGCAGLGTGGGAVRRWFSMKDMFCSSNNISV